MIDKKTVQRVRPLPADEVPDAPIQVATLIRLTQGQIHFLDRFRALVTRDTGCRISRALLLQVLVEVVSTVPPNLRNVASESDLTRRLCEASGRHSDQGRT